MRYATQIFENENKKICNALVAKTIIITDGFVYFLK